MKKFFYLGLTMSILLTSCTKNDDDKYYELPPNTGGTMELDGGQGGAMAANSVYVDFSSGRQTAVGRAAWNLGFHCGSEFGVKLNNTIGSRATEAEGIDLSTVIDQATADTYLEKLDPSMGGGDFTTADQITAETNLAGTIIKKDKTYIYCSGEAGKELYKVSVNEKNSSTYTVAYAPWNSAEVKTMEVAKNSDYGFVGISFADNAKVLIQPAKDEWDIVWGRSTYISAMAAGVPFMISDLVFLNTKSGTQALEIMVSDAVTYNNYTAEAAAQVQFSAEIDVIGSRWRNGGGPTTAPSAKTDRFYLIKDIEGNIYKLGFVSMNDGADGGKRGYPEIKYALLVEAK